MNIVLIMIFCSALYNTCQAPTPIAEYNSWYDCMNAGYMSALNKTKEVGRQTVDKELIYIKFSCKELTGA